MSDAPRRDDELTGLPAEEAADLETIADALRADRPSPNDPAFWNAMHQRIMNEVAVTPLAGAERARSRAGGWLRRLSRLPWRGRLVSAALGVVAVAALTLLVLMRDHPQEPLRSQPSPSLATSPGGDRDSSPGLAIPDELWEDGFFTHGSAVATGWNDDTAVDDTAVDDTENLLDETDTDWLAADWGGGDLDALDPFAADLDWGLGALDEDELQAFDELLGG